MSHKKPARRLTRGQMSQVHERARNDKRLRYEEANDALAARSILMMAAWDVPGWKQEAREFLRLR